MVMGSHGGCVNRGEIWLDSDIHRLPLATIRETDCGALVDVGKPGGVNSVDMDER